MRARLDEWFKREGIDKKLLAKAIVQAKPGSGPNDFLAKMNWWVNAKGQQVQPDDKGEFREGSIPYAALAMRNAEVKKAYTKLNPAPDLELL